MTIRLPEWDEQYHSKHGAVAEARHVFIEAGLRFFWERAGEQPVRILEIGFGTGLNAALTAEACQQEGKACDYLGVEAFPVSQQELEKLDYWETGVTSRDNFFALHQAEWGSWVSISGLFRLRKELQKFQQIAYSKEFDLIYFDAFGPRVQPELWTASIFEKMFNSLAKNGILITYSAKGSVRRAMQGAGFAVERLPGPPGKREMLRATRCY